METENTDFFYNSNLFKLLGKTEVNILIKGL